MGGRGVRAPPNGLYLLGCPMGSRGQGGMMDSMRMAGFSQRLSCKGGASHSVLHRQVAASTAGRCLGRFWGSVN